MRSAILALSSILAIWGSLLFEANALDLRSLHDSLYSRYSRAHSLGDDYQFDPRDGWQSVNVTDLQYKYSRRDEHDPVTGDDALEDPFYSPDTDSLERRAKKGHPKAKGKAKAADLKNLKQLKTAQSKAKVAGGFTSKFSKIIDSIKGVGKSEVVKITWYTGHDLENPSCWSNPTWAPTDESFACALTLEGWTTRPKCFKFIELCNTPKKCVHVRVVDSCAGCAPGSKHVDLTQAAFKELADLGEGLLNVQMRQATDPEGWLEELWGPEK
ncbi:hypothetical protein K474DRAFT_1655392 [Panus rudis PR-1116 ss-1]|nr:hypothetical protein K474DRAFT_1655392 [Panus rudis PR-1116 ss-1]